MTARTSILFPVLAIIIALTGVSCSKREVSPIIGDHKTTPAGEGETARGPKVPAIKEIITFNKQALLETEFFYGADLQYSSQRDDRLDLFSQAMVLGLVPAKFRIWENELQLMSQDERLFSSRANHPNQIISRYKIISQDENTIVVTAADSGIFLSQLGQSMNPYKSPEALQPRDSFIRSFEFVKEQNLVLQETTIRLADGARYDIMESLMPRSSVAVGKDFKSFAMNPDDPVGASEGDVARFRMLGGEKIFQNGEATSYAQHFDISQSRDGTGGTIDWWVTRNIPEEYLKPVQQGVEGFNRYFRNFKGINRDVVIFKGKLPENVKLGDPRYNVIAWDDITFAGAAYESQASDPFTGKQTHSLIYMPAAWLKIGENFWKDGQYSEKSKSVEGLTAGISSTKRIACIREMESYSAAIIDGILSGRAETSEGEKHFGIELLKAVVHHEVGHALGLAHNFKGSLSLDRSKPESHFSTSVMDYNDFQSEKHLFNGVDSADGPELAYDRQALSAIYNSSKDIGASDPVLPACNDAEADTEAGGVDPLCVRYDMENDPTLSVVTAFNRIHLAETSRKGESTLAQALSKIPSLLLNAKAVEEIKTEADVKKALSSVNSAMTAALRFYFASGTGSIQRAVRTNIKSLLVFKEGVLPESSYDERLMRERAFSGVNQAVALLAFPTAVKLALKQSQDAAISAISISPYVKGLEAAQRDPLIQKAGKEMTDTAVSFETSPDSGLSKVRTTILGSMVRKTKVPYYFGKVGKAEFDFETAMVSTLAEITMDDEKRTAPERLAAATSLNSYKGRGENDRVIRKVIEEIVDQLESAFDNVSRERGEKLLAALKK